MEVRCRSTLRLAEGPTPTDAGQSTHEENHKHPTTPPVNFVFFFFFFSPCLHLAFSHRPWRWFEVARGVVGGKWLVHPKPKPFFLGCISRVLFVFCSYFNLYFAFYYPLPLPTHNSRRLPSTSIFLQVGSMVSVAERNFTRCGFFHISCWVFFWVFLCLLWSCHDQRLPPKLFTNAQILCCCSREV
ncbi:hypothetical protein IWZ03DRAFT_96126 [Phyllosticta citriasiana]|uniref:Transmembrane protein n=1 Tax=Phyllosticta citriasiana TaxID=595635 RepID=A0ABR1KY68_9PEZI